MRKEERANETAINRKCRAESGLKGMRQLLTEEDGMGTVEIILIIVVLVGLVIIFKDRITELVGKIFEKITKQANQV